MLSASTTISARATNKAPSLERQIAESVTDNPDKQKAVFWKLKYGALTIDYDALKQSYAKIEEEYTRYRRFQTLRMALVGFVTFASTILAIVLSTRVLEVQQ